MFTYVAPLVFVLVVTMIKEAYDDYKRYRQDKLLNQTIYAVLQRHSHGGSIVPIKSLDIKVGQIIKVSQK